MTDCVPGRRATLLALPLLTAGTGVLHRAPDRFGGHKAEAIRLVHAALNEIEMAGVAFR